MRVRVGGGEGGLQGIIDIKTTSSGQYHKVITIDTSNCENVVHEWGRGAGLFEGYFSS